MFVFFLTLVAADENTTFPYKCPVAGRGFDDHFVVAQLLIKQQNLGQAEACLVDAVSASLGAFSLLSDMAAARHQTERALTFSAILETLSPNDGESVFLHAQRLGGVGKWDEALPRLRNLRSTNPRHANIANTLGVALFHTNDFEGAKKEFLYALALDPNSTEFKANLVACDEALHGATTIS